MINDPLQRIALIKKLLTGSGTISSTEAKKLLSDCEDCATDLHNSASHLRLLTYTMYHRGGLIVLNMSEKQFSSQICSVAPEDRHRTTINRQCQAAQMDYELGLPPGKVKESVLRMLRTKVLEDARGEVLKAALEEMGSYRKITAKVVVEVAEDLGFLNHRPVGETGGTKATPLSDGDERSSTEPSTEPSPIVDPHPETPEELGRDQSETSVVDGATASPVPDRVQPLVEMVKGKKSDLSFARRYLEISYVKPELIRKLESLSLEERQEALRRLNKIS